MLALLPEQLEALERLDRERFARSLAPALAELWPALAARLGERFGEFVELGAVAAQRERFATPLQTAGFVTLWCVWGPSFEGKPAFAWARAILDGGSASAPVRLHQLLQRTRELLQGPAPAAAASAATLAQFDTALARLPALAEAAAQRGVFVPPTEHEPVLSACDLALAEVAIAGTEWRHEYRCDAGGGRWHSAVPELPAMSIDATPSQPLVVVALGPPTRATPHSQLRLRLKALAQCDPARHPALTVDGPQGRLQWRGRDALALSLPLLGAPADGAGRAIGAEVEPLTTRLSIETCAVRDAGAPIGPVAVALQIYPAAQHLLDSRLVATPPIVLPMRGAAPPATTAPACRLECDGQPGDPRGWISAWQELQQQLAPGMEQLLNHWTRVAGVEQPRLEVELAALTGQATLVWGYRESGLAAAFMRIEGQLDLVACALDLRLSGEIADGPARARLRMRAQGRCELRTPLARTDAAVALDVALQPAVASWRFPFEIDIEPVAGTDSATLCSAASAAASHGALAGTAGLRPRADGGCEWFFNLRCEPAAVATMCCDPLFGSSTRSRPLLAPLLLVDWSSG